MIEIKNISKSFRKKTILADLSFKVASGDIAVLLGASGTGKSTLLRVLNGLEKADAGEVIYDGKNLLDLSIRKSHVISLVSQSYGLFKHLTTKENITLVLTKVSKLSKAQAEQKAQDWLLKFGLQDHADLSVTRLSGGQKQRLAIARALALGTKILCLDEPSSALDPTRTQELANIIQGLVSDGYIILLATHDMSLAMKLNCTLYLLDQGKMLETASAEEFFKNPKNFSHLDSFLQGGA